MIELTDRLNLPNNEKWNLTDIYDTLEDWENDYKNRDIDERTKGI